jgi:hypothetical protein
MDLLKPCPPLHSTKSIQGGLRREKSFGEEERGGLGYSTGTGDYRKLCFIDYISAKYTPAPHTQ